MQTFLERSAEHIYAKHNHAQISKICIVLPSRRGVLYFKQALSKLSDKPFLAPDVLAVDDFIMEMTGLRQIDQVALLFELFDVFKEIDPNVVFERFMTWASTLLNDFDKIDQYLVDPKALFSYISEAKALERWQMQLGESQKDRNLKTPRTDRYFKLFENIYTVYKNLRSRLTEKGLVYRGMAYRDLAENVDKYILEKDRHTKYYFVGFNALSDAEEKIIRTLLKRKNFAETIWDTDTYLLKNTYQKGGDWLRYYKNGKELDGIPPLYNDEWTWETNELLTGKKNIQIIGVPNASIQAKVAGHIYREWNSEEEKGKKGEREEGEKIEHRKPNIEHRNSQTAIVLGDENLLVPVMNSLDESVQDFNITMGLSLRNSMLFTLIDSLFELQRNLVEFKTEEGGTVKIPKFSHRQVVKVLNHPFLRRWELMKYQGREQKPHPQPLSDGEGSIRPLSNSTENTFGEGNIRLQGDSIERTVKQSNEYPPLHRGEVLDYKFYQKSEYEEWKILKPFARENRKNATETEEILWQNLRNRQLEGYKVRRQHTINLYIVDFVFLKQNLIIELDGEIHLLNDHPKYDEFRTRELNELGFRVLRFENSEITHNLDEVLKTVLFYLENESAMPESKIEYQSRTYSKVTVDEKSDEFPPLHRRGAGGEVLNPIRKTLQEITDRNRVFLSSKELSEISENDPMFTVLFKHWNNNPQNAIKCFYELIDLLRDVYKENQDAIETEYLFQFYLILQRMDGILENRKDTVAMRSFKMFLYEFIKQTKIPFESETDESLQIMGMLETRTLDFEKVIILSVNEGTLPLTNRQHTLIPFDALTDPQFNLPTYHHADAVMAYHFFRLLQRAKEIVLVHVLPSDTYGAGEKSRFILQIEHELAKANPNITLTYPTVKFIEGENKLHDETRLEIQKTEDILQFMEKTIVEKGIYPSHFNQYIQCSLQYYFSKIAGIAEAEEVEEKIGVDTFGNWIHKTFENIDKEFVENGGVVEKEELEKVLENIDSYLKQAFKETNIGLRAEEGMNYILYQVGETIVKKFINFQLKNEIFPFELLDVEKTLKVQFQVKVNDKIIPVNIAGRIDRMDRIGGNHVRVIDYKTGKVEAKDLKISLEDLSMDLLGNKDKDKFRQLWLYKYMVLKQMVSTKGLTIGGRKLEESENTVTSGIYSFRNIDEGLLQQNITFHEGETIQDFLYESEQYLQTFVQDLLNPEKPFEKRKDIENCVYCDYRRICGR